MRCRAWAEEEADKDSRLLAPGRPLEEARERLRISPDGSIVATASPDKTARLWDAATGQEIVTLRGHEAAIYSLAFSPDSKTLVTVSADRTARVWRTGRLSVEELISEACRRLAQIDQAPQHCQFAPLRTEANAPHEHHARLPPLAQPPQMVDPNLHRGAHCKNFSAMRP
jgi:WD40 repeat protein